MPRSPSTLSITEGAVPSVCTRTTPTRCGYAFKNAADRDYISDRTRGIQVGPPRLVQAGVRLLGGCCGYGPSALAALGSVVAALERS